MKKITILVDFFLVFAIFAIFSFQKHIQDI
jgi:hypothetical protein